MDVDLDSILQIQDKISKLSTVIIEKLKGVPEKRKIIIRCTVCGHDVQCCPICGNEYIEEI